MIGFLVCGRVRVKIRFNVRVRVGVSFNGSVYHWSYGRRIFLQFIVLKNRISTLITWFVDIVQKFNNVS